MTVLATNQGNPLSLARDGTTLYWGSLDNYRILKMSVGGGAVTSIAYPVERPTRLLVSGDPVYWATDASEVMRAPK